MAEPRNVPELVLLKGPSDDTQDAGRCVDQAAALVGQFSEARAVPALNALIAAAEQPAGAAAATDLRAAAQELTGQTETLYREVTRFLTLAPDITPSRQSSD